MICKGTSKKVPLCNRPIFYEDKKKMGMIDEVMGPIDNFAFYGNPFHLKDVQFFIPRPKPPKGEKMMNNQGSGVIGPRKTGNMISKPWQKGPEIQKRILNSFMFALSQFIQISLSAIVILVAIKLVVRSYYKENILNGAKDL